MIKCSSVYSQDEITLDEGLSAEVCGKIVVFDGIWMSEGKQKVDISVLESENSKPITGGYAMYDKININGCVYYISGIFKNGIKPAGKLKLSKNKPERVDKIMFTKVEIANNSKLYNNDPLSKIKIVRGSTGKPVIKTKYIENDVEIILTVGSVIWFEGYPFELTKISLEYKIAEFLIMKTYFYE
jgi:hypothetical protein